MMQSSQYFSIDTIGTRKKENWKTIGILNKNHETMYDGGDIRPVWLVSGREEDGTHWLLRVHGPRVKPSFGVPYEEFWKIMDDTRIVSWKRGPDTPFGEPVMEVTTNLPKDIGSGQDAIRNFVTRSFQGDVLFEEKVSVDLGIKGYLMFDVSSVRDFGYIHDSRVKPPADDFIGFHVQKMKVYFDSEWNMAEAFKTHQRISSGPGKKEWIEKSQVITIAFLESIGWTFHVFTWHPLVKKGCEYKEEYLTRISNEAKKKIPIMPDKYDVAVHACTSERELLSEMIDYLSDLKYDSLIGFNAFSGMHGVGSDSRWIAGFDMPWLYRRCMVKGIDGKWKPRYPGVDINRISPVGSVYIREDFGKEDVVIKMVTCLDLWHMMSFFEYHKKDKLKNEKLDTFMQKYLGVGKKVDGKYKTVWEQWEKEPREERIYCQADVEGTAGVEVLFNPSEDMYNRASFAGANWKSGMSAGRLHDVVNLRLYKGLYYLDTRPARGNPNARFWMWDGFSTEKVGGFNKEVIAGKRRNTAEMDFNKFYPIMGILTNCSPESFVNMQSLKLTRNGLVVVEKKPFLKRQVDDWHEFIKECREESRLKKAEGELDISIQNIVTDKLIGWKEVEYPWGDLIITPAGIFRKDIIARNVKAFMDMLKERKTLQKYAKIILELLMNIDALEYVMADLRQFSFKGFMNGRFGVQGNEDDRMYMLPLFNSYTMSCQIVIIECIRYAEEELGYPVSLSSTDSLYIDHKYPIEWIKIGDKYYSKEMHEVCEKIQKHAQEYAKKEFNLDDTSMLTMECASISKTMLIKNMRFYIKNVIYKDGMILPEPQLEFKGMKTVRREVAWIAESVQKRIANIIMNDGSRSDVENEVMKIHEDFKSLKLVDMCKTLPVSKKYEEYTETSEQYKAFKLADKYFDVDVVVGERFYIAPLSFCPEKINGKKVDPRLGDVVAFDEESLPRMIEAGLKFDMVQLEDKSAASPADDLLEAMEMSYWKILYNTRIADTSGDF